jgi:hypothetical protein
MQIPAEWTAVIGCLGADEELGGGIPWRRDGVDRVGELAFGAVAGVVEPSRHPVGDRLPGVGHERSLGRSEPGPQGGERERLLAGSRGEPWILVAVACGNGRRLARWFSLAPAVDELLEVGGLVGAGFQQLGDRGGGLLGGDQ